MYVQEIFSGLNPKNEPKISTFKNDFDYKKMILIKDIKLNSFCEHHLLPVIGRACVAYIPENEVIGLSKINRIVDFYARRPQLQERLTGQIANYLQKILKTESVAVVLLAKHYCVKLRGVQDADSETLTSDFSGKFLEEKTQLEFWNKIKM